ncbi:MAG: DUF4422 domain-containing protein [Hespellia sp.]|nr:DUF4422 domain-containing protein [Hespellia sp.]
MCYAREIVEELNQNHQIAVFGAGVVALGVVAGLREKPYQLNIECCLVSDLRENPDSIAGVPVMNLSEAKQRLSRDAVIIVTVVREKFESVRKLLNQSGYFHIIQITYEGDLWSLLRGNIYRESCLQQKKPYLMIEEELQVAPIFKGESEETSEKTMAVYTAKCHVDRNLKEDISRFSWEIPIQVGAALTDRNICEIRDNTGDHISEKNRQYCELTALYWIWKNDDSDYVGLGHYRRHFELTEEQLRQLAVSDIDVVLTIPIFDYPDVEAVYRRDHVGRDWDVMIEAVKKLSPEYLETLEEMQRGQFYYAYNMFIMRREVLENYCAWLFPILFDCEKHCGGERSAYQNRYIGFLAEHLMSLYFMHHEKEYKIVHARKHFIEE